MEALKRMRWALLLAIGLCAVAPARAQFDMLRRLVPQAAAADELYRMRGHAAAMAEINRRAGSGDSAQALRLAEELVARDLDPKPDSLVSLRGNLLGQAAALATTLHERNGNYARAIELQQMLLALRTEGDGRAGSQAEFTLLFKLGELYEKAGDDASARRTCEQLLALPASTAALNGPRRAALLARLGRTAQRTGDESLAESSLLRAIEEAPELTPAAGASPPGQGPGLAEVNAALGSALGRLGELRAALGADQAVMDGNGELQPDSGAGQNILAVAGPFTDLAALYHRQRNADALQKLYLGKFGAYAARSERATPDSFGPPAQLEREYVRFGTYLAALGQERLAGHAFGHALRLNAMRLKRSAADVQPELLAAPFALRRQILDLILSLRLAQGAAAAGWRAALGELLQSKGLQSEFLGRRARAIGRTTDPEVRRFAAEIDALDEAETGAGGAAGRHARRASLAQALQARVGKSLPPLAFEDGERFVDRVQQRLDGETLISLSLFTPFDFSSQAFGAAHYLAARVTRDAVTVVDLGASERLDALAARLRADLAHRPPAGAGRTMLPSSRALHDALLKPLWGTAPGKGAFVAELDGALALVPMEALADGGGRYLIEAGEWRYISSARALLRSAPAAAMSSLAVVLADPAYDLAPPVAPAAAPAGTRGAVLRTLRFQALPQTLEEGRAVAAALAHGGNQVAFHSGAEAGASVLEALHAPRYLHIATHGFFIEQAGVERERTTGADGARYVIEHYAAGRSSGLALAGANATLASGRGTGVMFAARLRQLDLADTELAVLSACDTAVGTVRPGEGVDSLRQALEVAGARSTVTSLWPVPDSGTRSLMTEFYAAVTGGASKPGALREAKLRMKQREGHPFYWASFVLTGAR
jgi:CHAT domain-containing protein